MAWQLTWCRFWFCKTPTPRNQISGVHTYALGPKKTLQFEGTEFQLSTF